MSWIASAVTGIIGGIILIAAIILIVVLIGNADHSGASRPGERRAELFGIFRPGERIAGERGEAIAARIIRSAMHDGDLMFTNVCIEYDGKPAELDNVIVNRYGVFIIEVKNYTGSIEGGEDDFEWRKYKVTAAGNVYEKTVKNPIRQVKRQTYILAHYLEQNGARVWIRGYAMLLKGNSPVNSEYVLCSAEDIERVIHTMDRTLLDAAAVNRIAVLLEETQSDR